MSDSKKGYPNKLDLLMNGLDESLLEMSDGEYTQYAKELGINIEEDSNEVRQIFRDADKGYRLRNLVKAESEYKQKSELVENIRSKYDLSTEKIKSILTTVIQSNKELSLQFRDLDKITGDDANSLLSDFIHLGLLNEEDLK